MPRPPPPEILDNRRAIDKSWSGLIDQVRKHPATASALSRMIERAEVEADPLAAFLALSRPERAMLVHLAGQALAEAIYRAVVDDDG